MRFQLNSGTSHPLHPFLRAPLKRSQDHVLTCLWTSKTIPCQKCQKCQRCLWEQAQNVAMQFCVSLQISKFCEDLVLGSKTKNSGARQVLNVPLHSKVDTRAAAFLRKYERRTLMITKKRSDNKYLLSD